MLRTSYLALLLVRLYFAAVSSYIHPDEHFQGPEVITGEVFGWPSYKTWEFTSAYPIRSVFPLWLVYGPPLTVFKWIVKDLGSGASPMALFYVLRLLMFLLSFVLEDWAVYELFPVKRERAVALMLMASSYVTWTFQMHTFSNSIETLVVLWCLVLMANMRDSSEHTQVRGSIALAFLGVLGIFNRITFPAFLVVAGVELLPHLLVKPMRLVIMLLVGSITALVAIALDTEYYTGQRFHFRHLGHAVVTPYNNLIYNLDSANLAEHGLHPFWQHFLANLPQLLGPAFPLLAFSSRKSTLFWSGVVGTAILSCFRHQEPRFLLPAVPLLLSSIKLPARHIRAWASAWLVFNVLAAIVFGIYHQGGVIPVQAWVEQQSGVSQVFWWKTYSPPRWLLGDKNGEINTTDLMGMPIAQVAAQLSDHLPCHGNENKTLLVAPSNVEGLGAHLGDVNVQQVMRYRRHVGLDDLDFADDGVWPTLKRVVGGRGLTVWQATKDCRVS